MKYGIAVRIVETGYVEIEADCEAEAKAMAEERHLTVASFSMRQKWRAWKSKVSFVPNIGIEKIHIL